jgi:hypothetical protein
LLVCYNAYSHCHKTSALQSTVAALVSFLVREIALAFVDKV